MRPSSRKMRGAHARLDARWPRRSPRGPWRPGTRPRCRRPAVVMPDRQFDERRRHAQACASSLSFLSTLRSTASTCGFWQKAMHCGSPSQRSHLKATSRVRVLVDDAGRADVVALAAVGAQVLVDDEHVALDRVADLLLAGEVALDVDRDLLGHDGVVGAGLLALGAAGLQAGVALDRAGGRVAPRRRGGRREGR